jgi:hypothetical protein
MFRHAVPAASWNARVMVPDRRGEIHGLDVAGSVSATAAKALAAEDVLRATSEHEFTGRRNPDIDSFKIGALGRECRNASAHLSPKKDAPS